MRALPLSLDETTILAEVRENVQALCVGRKLGGVGPAQCGDEGLFG